MSTPVTIPVTCPYCGFEQKQTVEVIPASAYSRMQVVVCDIEEGGCDEDFIIQPKIEITPDIYTIERYKSEFQGG